MASYVRTAVNFGSAPTGAGGDNNRAGIQKVDADLAQLFASFGFDSTTNDVAIGTTGAAASGAKTNLLLNADFSADQSSVTLQDAGATKFHLGVSETENVMYIFAGGSLASGTRHFSLDSSGEFGFGRAPVSAVTAAFNDDIEVIDDGGSSTITSKCFGVGSTIWISSRAKGTESSPTAVLSGDILARFDARAYDGSGFDADGPYQTIQATENWGASAHGMKQTFSSTADGATSTTLRMTLEEDGGLFMAGATGSSQGAGTINGTGVFDDGSLLTCYVADALIDGDIDLVAWDARVPDREYEEIVTEIPAVMRESSVLDADGNPTMIEVEPARTEVVEARAVERKHDPAARFKDRMARDLDPETFYEDFMARRALPAMPTREEWATNGPLSVGDTQQRLWETIETLVGHIHQQNERIKALENA